MSTQGTIKKLNAKTVALFLYLWLLVGFILGTFVLTGPLRSFITYLRNSGYSQTVENIAAATIVIVYVAVSFGIAKVFWSWFREISKRSSKVIFHTSFLGVLTLCLWFWLTPAGMDKSKFIVSADGRFVAGQYPTRADMFTLRKQGYTAVISLLSPLVVPFEPVLLEKEKATAQELGMQLIHVPLVPWLSTNEDSIKKIESLAQQQPQAQVKQKYYVHCYLGKDRVRMFMAIVNRFYKEQYPEAAAISSKRLNLKGDRLERGPVLQLADGLLAGPMPTKDEFRNLVINSPSNIADKRIKTVVSLHGRGKKSNSTLVGHEREILKPYGVSFHSLPVRGYPYNAQKILSLARKIKALERPLLVYDFLMPNQSIAMEAFILAFLTDLPSLPRQLFFEPMQRGNVEIIAPNIAIGPRPMGTEFTNYLAKRGIRSFIFIGRNTAKARFDRRVARSAGLRWQRFTLNDPKLMLQLAKDGPWYVYGETSEVKTKIESEFGQLMPKDLPFYQEFNLDEP